MKRLMLGGLVALLGCASGTVDDNTNGPGPNTASLSWDAPTTDADGTAPLTDLAGYRVYYGTTSPLTRDNSQRIDLGITTSHVIENLEPGTYYFAVSAVDDDGNESELSNEASKTVTE